MFRTIMRAFSAVVVVPLSYNGFVSLSTRKTTVSYGQNTITSTFKSNSQFEAANKAHHHVAAFVFRDLEYGCLALNHWVPCLVYLLGFCTEDNAASLPGSRLWSVVHPTVEPARHCGLVARMSCLHATVLCIRSIELHRIYDT
jgi:hypothetical protein